MHVAHIVKDIHYGDSKHVGDKRGSGKIAKLVS